MSERVFIGVGSNLGEREIFIEKAISAVSHLPGTKLLRRASLYETEPVGLKEQPQFLNTVIEIETSLHPRELLQALKEVERDLGRQQRERWGPREIDLDILLYGDQILDLPNLRIPHPECHRRAFVLVPLVELAPQLEHPVLGCPIENLLQVLGDERGVHLFPSDKEGQSSLVTRQPSPASPSKKRFL